MSNKYLNDMMDKGATVIDASGVRTTPLPVVGKFIRVEIRVLENTDDEPEAEGFEEYFCNLMCPDDWDDERIKDEVEDIQRHITDGLGSS